MPRLPQPRFLNLELPDGRRGRMIQVDFVPQIDDDGGVDIDVPLDPTRIDADSGLHVALIVVARSSESLNAQFRTLGLLLAGFVATFLAFLSQAGCSRTPCRTATAGNRQPADPQTRRRFARRAGFSRYATD